MVYTIKDQMVAEAMRFSRDGTKLAVTFEDHSVRVFDSGKGTPHFLLMRGHVGKVTSVEFSQDGRLLASVSDDSTARVWEVTSGRELAAMNLPSGTGGSFDQDVSFSADGLSVLIASAEGVMRWRCDACGGLPQLLAAVQESGLDRDRPLSADEQRRFGLGHDPLGASEHQH